VQAHLGARPLHGAFSETAVVLCGDCAANITDKIEAYTVGYVTRVTIASGVEGEE
jgi:hypothetical protein